MARFLAIDWDDTECRYILASVQKGSVAVRKAGAVVLESALENEEEGEEKPKTPDLSDVSAALRKLAKEERLEACPVLVALDRSKVEMLYTELPPCRESEIPVMLKNQVLRELHGYSDYDPLDYLPLGNNVEEGRNLLALTIPMSFRQQLVRAFRSAGRPTRSIGLRAVAAAELVLWGENAPEKFEPGLVVNVVGNEVDLVLLEGEYLVSLRSFRLPEQLSFTESVERIANEVRRTLTIGLENMTAAPIKKVILFGGEDDWTPLLETLGGDGLEAVLVNPFTLPGVACGDVPAQPGRFAPLMGLLFAQQPGRSSQRKSVVDFLHPKEAPKPTNYVLAVFLALILLCICGYGLFVWNRGVIRSMEEELAKVKEEHAQVAAQIQTVYPNWNVLAQTKNWESQNVPWLDELRSLSILLPAEQDLVVSQMSFVTGPINNNPRMRAMIQMSGMVRDPTVLRKLQLDLRKWGYLMQNPNPSVNPAGGGYPWVFQTSIYRVK